MRRVEGYGEHPHERFHHGEVDVPAFVDSYGAHRRSRRHIEDACAEVGAALHNALQVAYSRYVRICRGR